MIISLKLPHAKALAAIEEYGPFDLIREALDLAAETATMEKALKNRAADAVKKLRRTGATLQEITERSGIQYDQIQALLTRETPATDADVLARHPEQ